MGMDEKSYLYAIPHEYFEKYGVRRYGFHGTSHGFVSKEAIKFGNLPADAKVIVCHIGNGASVSASIGGKCVDTSMGLTPLEGLIMGTLIPVTWIQLLSSTSATKKTNPLTKFSTCSTRNPVCSA